MELNKPAIKKWVEALRSGKFKQTRGDLHGKVGHCCIGVAEEIFHAAEFTHLPCGAYDYNVSVFLGYGPQNEKKLIDLNDAGHKSFSYIADWIEKNILGKKATA